MSRLLLVCTCFRHGSLLCTSSNFIHFACLILHYTSSALLLRYIPYNSASFISATFSTPATNFSARLHSRSGCVQWAFIFLWRLLSLPKHKKINQPIALVLQSCGMPFCLPPSGEIKGAFCHTGNIVCIRIHRTSSCSHAAHPLSTRRWLAAQRFANHSFRWFSYG